MSEPRFPPLFSGLGLTGVMDPFEKACVEAARGCDAGLVVHNLSANDLRAAIVFAPDVTLADAMAMLPLCGVGFQNAVLPPDRSVLLDGNEAPIDDQAAAKIVLKQIADEEIARIASNPRLSPQDREAQIKEIRKERKRMSAELKKNERKQNR